MKNTFKLAGKTYTAEVINGVRYVDGMTLKAFFDKLAEDGNVSAIADLLQIGAAKVDGTLPANSAVEAANILHAGRTKLN